MYSLFRVRFNWVVYIGICMALRMIFMDMSLPGFVAICVFVHQVMILISAVGHVIPVRYLFGVLLCLQYFVGPALAYYGLDRYQYFKYRMLIAENEYFLYAIPSVVAFIIGLHYRSGKLKGEQPDVNKIAASIRKSPDLPYIFIVVGFLSSILSSFFSSSFDLVFYIIGGFKFVGLFMLILGSSRPKPIMLIVIYGSILISSLVSGMFHDLVTWVIFLGFVLAYKYKPGIMFKIAAIIVFSFLVIVLQQLKPAYRSLIGYDRTKAGIETLTDVYEEANRNESVFNGKKLAASLVRINQGFIQSRIMAIVPEYIPYQEGNEFKRVLEATFLPRFIVPDKLKAGDKETFYRYTHLPLRVGTSMSLGSLGNAYIDFGKIGGCIFMFLLGLFYNTALKIFHNKSISYPLLLVFIPLFFYYPIRPDTALQTALGHLIKSVFVIVVLFYVWRRHFYLGVQQNLKPNS